MLERFDKDGDGELDEEESETMRGEMKDRPGRQGKDRKGKGKRGDLIDRVHHRAGDSRSLERIERVIELRDGACTDDRGWLWSRPGRRRSISE